MPVKYLSDMTLEYPSKIAVRYPHKIPDMPQNLIYLPVKFLFDMQGNYQSSTLLTYLSIAFLNYLSSTWMIYTLSNMPWLSSTQLTCLSSTLLTNLFFIWKLQLTCWYKTDKKNSTSGAFQLFWTPSLSGHTGQGRETGLLRRQVQDIRTEIQGIIWLGEHQKQEESNHDG